jgi:hypothetical protein
VKERVTAFVTPLVPGLVAGPVGEVETEVAREEESRRTETVAETEMDPPSNSEERNFFPEVLFFFLFFTRGVFREASFALSLLEFRKLEYIGRLCSETAFYVLILVQADLDH